MEAGVSDHPELATFLREQVRSVWGLELILLLRRTHERCWAVAELVGELRASQTLVADNLASFERNGLVIREADDCYRFAVASPALDQLVDQMARAYQERPVSVINMIAKPPDPLQSLADAFKLRGGS
jgi:hypothetical protein